MNITGRSLFFAASLALPCFLYAQKFRIDSSYILHYKKTNEAEIYGGDYFTHFNFSDKHFFKSNYKLVANTSGYLGGYFNYNWLSLKYSFALPGTELAKNADIKYASLRYKYSGRRMIFHAYYETYHGLLIPSAKEDRKDSFKTFRGIRFRNTGIDYFYLFNAKKFSYYAANNFTERQLKPAGTLMIMITPLFQKIDWENPSRDLVSDSSTFKLLSSDPQWFSFISRLGYSYNMVWKQGKWSIAPALLFGAGFVKELNTRNNGLQLVTDLQTWINAGYNGDKYYAYLNARWGNLQTNLLIKTLHQADANVSLTLGYRFGSLKKKILGLL